MSDRDRPDPNLEIIFDNYDPERVPWCPHGPALLFQRNRPFAKFYACSACRDKRECSLFYPFDETLTEEKLARLRDIYSASLPSSKPIHLWKRFKKILKQSLKQRVFCTTCEQLVLPKERENHENHNLNEKIRKSNLVRPSKFLLEASTDNRTGAQYLFADSTTEFIIKTLNQLDYSHVLLIGCPRIYEEIRLRKNKFQFMLMDIDQRFRQFYSPKSYLRYNLLNHHFFDENAKSKYVAWLQGATSLVVIVDPPFGALVQVLAQSLSMISQDFGKSVDFVLFFPYFMKVWIQRWMPRMRMVDYKVEYANHRKFNGGSERNVRKKGSAVRIFTDVELRRIPLPAADGYRFCETCQRYSAMENVHCPICDACTSEDGSTYVHCSICSRCVKPSWVHCSTCGRCALPEHPCLQAESSSEAGCFHCGNPAHKRRYCPLISRKRAR